SSSRESWRERTAPYGVVGGSVRCSRYYKGTAFSGMPLQVTSEEESLGWECDFDTERHPDSHEDEREEGQDRDSSGEEEDEQEGGGRGRQTDTPYLTQSDLTVWERGTPRHPQQETEQQLQQRQQTPPPPPQAEKRGVRRHYSSSDAMADQKRPTQLLVPGTHPGIPWITASGIRKSR
ncbi:hypothetical protein BaRGS_00000513, partial [Batillaria attramentaria]